MRRYITIAIVAVILMAVAVLFGYIKGYTSAMRDAQGETKTDTIVRVDTVRIHHPADTVTLTQWKTYHVHDTAIMVEHDSVFVILPYESHLLTMPDTLDLWYSGVDARVDSMHFYLRTVEVTQSTSITKPKRLNTIGVEAGFSDASLLYVRQLGRVSLGFSAGYTYDRQATVRGFLGWNF